MNDVSRETAAAPDADRAESVGQFLKQERLRQNKTLKEVAEATCIHINTLEALEEENRARLPAEVFVRGFISNYAQYLKLDPQEALNRYGRKMTTEWISPGAGYVTKVPSKTEDRPKKSGARRVILLLGLAAAALLGLWVYRQSLPPSADRLAEKTLEKALSSAGKPEAERIPGSPGTEEQAGPNEAVPLPGGAQTAVPAAESGAGQAAAPAPEQTAPPVAAPEATAAAPAARTAPESAASAQKPGQPKPQATGPTQAPAPAPAPPAAQPLASAPASTAPAAKAAAPAASPTKAAAPAAIPAPTQAQSPAQTSARAKVQPTALSQAPPAQTPTPAATAPARVPAGAKPAGQAPATATATSTAPAAKTAAGKAAEAPAPSPAGDAANTLEARFTQTTWVRVRLDGKPPAEYLFQPGERHSWKADTIDLFLGNAGGADLVLNGEPQPSPGPPGKTARLTFGPPPSH
ncbi:MAG: DUF4115 domain-containing protein [Desulfobacteraceae bacterium]|nr:DUF4115 domain-containing protein [Desulfobacteraceae bacterium]